MNYQWIWGTNKRILGIDFQFSEVQLYQLDSCLTSLQDTNNFVSWLKQQVKGVPATVTGGFSIMKADGKIEWINRFTHAQQWKNLSQLREQFMPSNCVEQISIIPDQKLIKVPIFDIKKSNELQAINQNIKESHGLNLTPFNSQSKMLYYNSNLKSKDILKNLDKVKCQKIKNSFQIQGDITMNWDQMKTAALDCIKNKDEEGKFTVILMDPPWKHTGHSFNYKTIENHLWMNKIKFKDLQDSGFVFMWVTNKYIDAAVDFMKTQEYKRIETISWIKVCKNGALRRGMGRNLWHSQEQCLVFRKLAKGISDTDFSVLRAAENVIISQPKGKFSMKPFQLYELIEAMVPGGKYLEIFGRPHNKRAGWVTMGDEAICFDTNYIQSHKSLKSAKKESKSNKIRELSKNIKKKKKST